MTASTWGKWLLAGGLTLGAIAVSAGCDREEKLLDIETPSGEVEVDRDVDSGEVDVEVTRDRDASEP